jgi:subtilisin family serine protease
MARNAQALSMMLALASMLIAAGPAIAQKKPGGDTLGVDTSTIDPGKPTDPGKATDLGKPSDPGKPAGEPGPGGKGERGNPGTPGDGKTTGDGDKPAGDDSKTTVDDGAGKERSLEDCLAEKAKADSSAAPVDPDCKDKIDEYGRVVVVVPDVLVDLFPTAPVTDGGKAGSGVIVSVDVGLPQGGTSSGGGTTGEPSKPGVPATTAASGLPPAASPSPGSPAAVVPRVAPPTVSPQAVSGAFVPDEVLVTIDGGTAEAADIAASFGLAVRSQRRSELLGTTIVRFGIPDGRPVATVLAQLAVDPRALARVPNHIVVLQQAGAVVNYAFKRISLAPEAASGAGVKVAVIDTAIDAGNPALSGVIADEYDAMPDVEQKDRNHGTSVAGLIAGVGPFRGMAPGATIYHARAFEGGRSTMDVILDALDWAAGKDVAIINMSFVGPDNDLLKAASANARARGMVLVAAAGNNGPGAPYGYPGAYPGVIAVTATDADDALMPEANRGPYVYVSAPGVAMLAPVDGGTDAVTGTSFAAAIVSGAVANLIHENPNRTADWIEKALAETASDLGPAGRDDDFGYGLINAGAAAQLK